MFAAMSLPLIAAEFAPPAEGPVPFRRDQIPLDAAEMGELSKNLEVLARGLPKETPASYRGAAQMLALAMAVDPGNTSARELVALYQKDQLRTDENQDRIQRSRSAVEPLVPWLESGDAGRHGKALAACLKDVLAISSADAPALAEINSLGAWEGWIPDLSAYEDKQPAEPEPSGPAPETPPPSKGDIVLSQAQIQTVLWKNLGTAAAPSWVMAPAPLQMSVHKMGLVENRRGEMVKAPFSIRIGAYEDEPSLNRLGNMTVNLLRRQHDSLPAEYQIQISSKELEHSLSSGRRHSLSAAAALLANAALTGTEPDAIVLGQIDETGLFKVSSDFWRQLRGLGKGTGQRLVLPTESATFLPSMLAFENPAFFVEYEVLLASNLEQLADLTAKTPSKALADQSAKFAKIRETAGTQDIRQHIINRFVRQRLAEIAKDAPYHYSAQMLLVQATGKRPTTVIRPVLLSELTTCLEPLQWIADVSWEVATSKIDKDDSPVGIPFREADVGRFGTIYEQCRKRLDELERLAGKEDAQLMEHARKIAVSLRALDRTLRTRNSFSSYDKGAVAANRSAAHDFAITYRDTMKQLLADTATP